MDRRDCIFVGLKILGVYFGVLGLVSLAGVLYGFIYRMQNPGPYEYQATSLSAMMAFLQPLAYFLAFLVLTQGTHWCMARISCQEHATPDASEDGDAK